MTPQELKASILQLAIQGKLVSQIPEEGTGEELFHQIQAEKQQQIKCGTLRKTKALPEITEDQLPGTFPDSWKICYIDDIAFVTKLAGFEYSSVIASNLSTSGIPLFKGKNVQNGKLVLDFESYIPENVSNELRRSQILKRCLLTPYVGTIGNIAVFDGSFKAHLGSNVGKIELLNGEEQYVLEEYVLYYLRSDIGYRELTKYKKATAQESISIDAIRNVIIAIPPLAEQKRIVAKIEELLPLIDRYEQAWSRLEDFNKRFPVDMQKSILQTAIQGKLVEQHPEEGTGEDLFLQIQAERQVMIKAGKIKKGKAYPAIDEDEIPFDIPETWTWARLQDLVYNRGQKIPNETFCYIDIGSIDNKRQKLNPEDNVIEANKAPSRARKIIQMGDILYSTVRPYLHNMCIIDREFSLEPIASTGFAAMTCFEGIDNKYLFYYLLSPAFDSYANDTENAKGVAYPAINDDRLYRAVVPVPPLAEQKRIVAKLEEILPLCEKLK